MNQWATIQTVVFPLDRDPNVLPLYADPDSWTTTGNTAVRLSSNAHIDNVLSRTSAKVGAGKRVSYASYFNAFPASYWQHWTKVSSVRLTLQTNGAGTLLVYRSNAQGIAQRMESRTVAGQATTTIDLPIAGFGDGGWYWFDIVADNDTVVLEHGSWLVDHSPVHAGKVSLGITTFNKPDYCVATLAARAAQNSWTRSTASSLSTKATSECRMRQVFPTLRRSSATNSRSSCREISEGLAALPGA